MQHPKMSNGCSVEVFTALYAKLAQRRIYEGPKAPHPVTTLELKKWGALRGQGKCRGGQHKCLSCKVIFHCFED